MSRVLLKVFAKQVSTVANKWKEILINFKGYARCCHTVGEVYQ